MKKNKTIYLSNYSDILIVIVRKKLDRSVHDKTKKRERENTVKKEAEKKKFKALMIHILG